MKCGEKCEIWSRVCGYFQPTHKWNKGKKEEFKDRKTFMVQSMDKSNKFRETTKLIGK